MDIWRQSGSDLICQVSNVLSSVIQHVAHAEDGAERVVLRMVVATLDLVSCHGGGEVPSEQNIATRLLTFYWPNDKQTLFF